MEPELPVHAHDALHVLPEEEFHAVALQRRLDDRRGGRVLLVEQVRLVVHQLHMGSEAGKGLGQFAANGTAADNDQAPGLFGEIEDRFVGEEARLRQAGNVRNRRPGAGGNHRLGEPQPGAGNLHDIGSQEPSAAEKHIDSQRLHSFRAVVGTDGGADFADPFHHGRKIHGELSRHTNSEAGGLPDGGGGAAGTDQGFRRHAAVVETIPAEQRAFHQGHFGAETGGTRGGDQTGRSAAHDHQIVARGRPGIHPTGWVRLGEQRLVVAIQGGNGHGQKSVSRRSRRRGSVEFGLQRSPGDSGEVHGHRHRSEQTHTVQRPFGGRTLPLTAGQLGDIAGQRAQPDKQQRPGHHAQPGREHEVPQPNPGHAEGVVQQIEREHRRQSQQTDNLPAFPADGGIDGAELRIPRGSGRDPIPGGEASHQKTHRGSERGSE